MDTFQLSLEDEEILNAATELINRRAEYGHHHIACALRTSNGQTFLGLHVSANIGKGSVCAEAAAIADALKNEPATVERIVSVRYQFKSEPHIEVVPPCGQCCELILEHGPHSLVIVRVSSKLVLVPISQLLPVPFHRRRN